MGIDLGQNNIFNGLTVAQANTLLGTGMFLGGKLIGANFASTADQAITITSPSTNYIVNGIFVVNPSADMSVAVIPLGGFYTAASKAGAAIVAATQTYASLTSPTINTSGSMISLTVAAVPGIWQNGSTIYFSLSTAHGSALTADIYVYIRPMP